MYELVALTLLLVLLSIPYSHCMSTGMVIMNLTFKDENGKEEVIAENPLVNSPWAVRPLRVYFAKETKGNFLTLLYEV